MENHFFEELLAIMGVSLVATVVLQRLKMPNIVAYILAGALIGPHVLNWVKQPGEFAFLAEFGVVFLLFSLGLEFSLPKLIALRRVVFVLGGIQVLCCSVIFGVVVYLWGASLSTSVIIAGALALSSTAIVTKELSSLRQVHSRHGQLSIGVLLFQDLAAVLFLILVPVLAGNDTESLGITLGWALLKGISLMIALLCVGKWILPHLYHEVARQRSEEVFVLSTLVIVMLAAWVTHSFELSMALGGFIIGMMLGESHFRHQINADIRAFKDILLGLFFVTVGMNVQIELLVEYWPRIVLFTGALILIKTCVVAFIVRIFGDDVPISLQTGFNLAQAGEFGLALLALAVMHGVVPDEQASFIIIVAILSMAVSPFLLGYGGLITDRMTSRFQANPNVADTATQNYIQLPESDHVIVGGYGRVGKTIARMLRANNIEYVVIDNNREVVVEAQKRDVNVLFGDCTKMDMLYRCHIDSARLAVLTFHSLSLAKDTVEHIRASGVDVPIIVRLREQGDFAELISVGADLVVPEMLEGSLIIGRYALRYFNLEEEEIDQTVDLEREAQLSRS